MKPNRPKDDLEPPAVTPSDSVPLDPEVAYEALRSGEKPLGTFSPVGLFELAHTLAAKGNLAAKKDIYELILVHPLAIPDDTTRVLAYRADMQRRDGDAAGALAALETLPIPTDPVVAGERLQAISECRRLLGDKAGYLADKKAIVAISEAAGPALPPGKKLFYSGGLINGLLENEADLTEVALYLAQYDQHRQELPPEQQPYHAHEYHALSGIYHEKIRDVGTALTHYKAQQLVEHDTKFRVVGALRYLAAAWKVNPEDRGLDTLEMARFFTAHEREMQPAWVKALQTEYDLVTGTIARLGESMS